MWSETQVDTVRGSCEVSEWHGNDVHFSTTSKAEDKTTRTFEVARPQITPPERQPQPILLRRRNVASLVFGGVSESGYGIFVI